MESTANEILDTLRKYVRATEALEILGIEFADHIKDLTDSAPIDVADITNACEEYNERSEELSNEVSETWETLSQWAIHN
ncbi:hypothetical protein [Ensifer sp. SL37]|uniref:hypothetical protein n=1 Tax=Ensifer sp. SL37 TaxID=2995137 RepID=UPI0022741C35|nr:hypothetical protein [Ensifer sp. SL37]MCY1741434.1 hypothetical protein [Ensifer sp. SL37]